MDVTVTRSSIRLLLYMVLAVPAIILAIDMTVSHRWYPAPDTYNQVVGSTIGSDGQTVDITVPVLNIDGKAQRRRDLATGGTLFAAGVLAMAWAAKGLLRPDVLLRSTSDGISVRVDGPRHPPRLFPWESIAEIRSGVIDLDGADSPVLSLLMNDPAMVPTDPAGGVARPPWLHLWTEEWDRPAHELAPLLQPWVRGAVPH